MKWALIVKTDSAILESYGYNDPRVKEHLRAEGALRCVYCAVHENKLGGIQSFHVEHYRPKSRFKNLINSLRNLFYACPICNRFKSNDWPAEPHRKHKNCSYPDPSKTDYSLLFRVNEEDGTVAGLFTASKYIVERLYFNRPQLILERKQHFLAEQLSSLSKSSKGLIRELKARGDRESLGFLAKLAETQNQLNELFLRAEAIPLYESKDVSRTRK